MDFYGIFSSKTQVSSGYFTSTMLVTELKTSWCPALTILAKMFSSKASRFESRTWVRCVFRALRASFLHVRHVVLLADGLHFPQKPVFVAQKVSVGRLSLGVGQHGEVWPKMMLDLIIQVAVPKVSAAGLA